MADEIEEFLRRAAMRRAAQQQAAQQQAAQQPAYQPPAYQPPPAARPALQSSYVDVEPVEVEIVHDEGELGAGVSSHVAQAMDNREFAERTRQLGGGARQADVAIQSHVQQKFDHQVGQLRSTTEARPPAQPSFEEARQGAAGAAPAGAGDAAAAAAGVSAAEIVQLLRTPRNIRHAIIMNEILTRPVDRW